MSEATLVEIAHSLYAGPLRDFTATRNAEAKAIIADSGDRGLASAVKKLRKPSLAAWVVNLLVRREGSQISEMLKVADELRAAQNAMDGDQLRALTRQRRQLTAALTNRARALATEQGVRVTPNVAEQVEATLTAALLSADAAAALRTGLIVEALKPTVGSATSSLMSLATPEALGYVPQQVAPATLRVVPDPDAEAKSLSAQRWSNRAELEASLASAQTRVSLKRAEFRLATEAVTALHARTLQGHAEMDELTRRVTALESELEQIDDDLIEAERSAAAAESALTQAEEARDRAAKAFDGFS